jgi:uncharacterized protein
MALPSPGPDTTVVVTGASSGIGAAIARELAARGHGLSLVARRAAVLEQLAGELEERHGVEVAVHAADLGDDDERERLLEELAADGRDVVGLCNNAGVGAFGRVADHDPALEERVVRLNVLAVHALTARLLGPMVARGAGAVLNVGSILAFAPIPQNASYAATKAFVTSLSEALHTELAGTGVSCTVVSPGPTRTEIFTASGAPGAAGFGPGLLWQDPDDVARAAVDAMAEGRRTVVPGLTNKLAALGYRFTPRTPFLPVARLAQSSPVRRLLLGEEAAEGA